MSKRLKITVVAIDEDRKTKATYQHGVEVPDSTYKMNEALTAQDPDETLRMVSQGAISAAVASVQPKGSGDNASQLGQMMEGASAKPPPRGTPQGKKLESMLGLDIIEHMDRQDRGEVTPGASEGGGPPQWARQQMQPQGPRPIARPQGPHTTGPRPPNVG